MRPLKAWLIVRDRDSASSRTIAVRCLGEIRHKEQWYPGEYQTIIDQDLWDKAHAILAQNRAQRGDRQYRYNVTHTASKRGHEECPDSR